MAKRGPISAPPKGAGWIPLNAYTRAVPEEPGEVPWGEDHAWHVAERKATWQTWRTWLGERNEDLRAPCQAACPVGTNAGLYVSLIAEGRYDEALGVASEPNPFPVICGRVCTAPCEDVCRRRGHSPTQQRSGTPLRTQFVPFCLSIPPVPEKFGDTTLYQNIRTNQSQSARCGEPPRATNPNLKQVCASYWLRRFGSDQNGIARLLLVENGLHPGHLRCQPLP